MSPSTWPKWFKISLGITIPLIGLVGSVAGGMWALDERYEPRKELAFEFKQIATTQQMIQNKISLSEIRSWLVFWQLQVELYTGMYAKDPSNSDTKHQLDRARRERNKWQNRLQDHINP